MLNQRGPGAEKLTIKEMSTSFIFSGNGNTYFTESDEAIKFGQMSLW